jgi:hypothetical protein
MPRFQASAFWCWACGFCKPRVAPADGGMYGCLLVSLPFFRDLDAASVRGKKFYGPAVIAGYAIVLGFGAGVCLYGVNVLRRGNRLLGGALAVAGAGLYLVKLLSRVSSVYVGAEKATLGGLGILGLYHLSTVGYAQLQANGARPARWWLPALVAIAISIAMVMVREFWV